MEYLMWAKRKSDDSNSHINLVPPPVINSYGDSWEEQAFAEDAAGALGGCVWPPRSYSCSFCRREFRSAQALGGHMNVHRRDRARLKQNPNPQSEVVVAQNHGLNPCSTLSFDAPTFLYKNPNSNEFYDPRPLVSVSNPRNVSRVSSLEPIKVNSEEKTSTTLSFFSPIVEKNHMINIKVPISTPPPISWSSFVAEKRDFRVLRQIENCHEKKSLTTSEKDCHGREDCVAVNLNLVVSQTPSSDEEVGSCKRRRTEANPLSFLEKLSAVDRCKNLDHQSEVFTSSTEELDLELRLGDAPKVK